MRVTPYDQVFPALELSQARATQRRAAPAHTDHAFGDGSGLVAVRVRARHAGERVRVDDRCAGSGTRRRASRRPWRSAGRDYELHPPLVWDAGALMRRTPRRSRAQLQFHPARATVPPRARARSTVSLRPLSEALYFVRDGRDSVDSELDLRRLRRRARSGRRRACSSWRCKVELWKNSTATPSVDRRGLSPGLGRSGRRWRRAASAIPTPIRASRAVRASSASACVCSNRPGPDRSANCIDGSVLIASVLQRIGLRSFLVLVPGHAFVGFYTRRRRPRTPPIWKRPLLGAPSPRLAEIARLRQTLRRATRARAWHRRICRRARRRARAPRRAAAQARRSPSPGLRGDRHRRGARLRYRADRVADRPQCRRRSRQRRRRL